MERVSFQTTALSNVSDAEFLFLSMLRVSSGRFLFILALVPRSPSCVKRKFITQALGSIILISETQYLYHKRRQIKSMEHLRKRQYLMTGTIIAQSQD